MSREPFDRRSTWLAFPIRRRPKFLVVHVFCGHVHFRTHDTLCSFQTIIGRGRFVGIYLRGDFANRATISDNPATPIINTINETVCSTTII